MSVFSYQAVNRSSATVRGTVAADSPREAREKLRAQGLLIEDVSPLQVESRSRRFFRQASRSATSDDPQQSATASSKRLFDRPGRHAAQLAIAIRDLATLLGTGISLVDALDTLTAQHGGPFQASLLVLRERVAGGSSLAEAMRADPAVFDVLTVQMVGVGENAGTLDLVLDQLADFRERSLLFKDQVTTALLYPAIVVALAIGVSVFLMTVVLPMLLENLVASGRPLPWPTRVLKGMSDLATTHGPWLLPVALLSVAALALAARTTRGKRLWHQLLFALPLLGPLAKKQEIARSALVVSTLLSSGIVFIDAVQIAAKAARNVLLREAFGQIETRVQSGGDIGDALATTGVFPPLVVQIFTVGQQTGKLEQMLNRLAAGYERQVASATARLTAALEPVLIVFLALFVGFILFATILPILEAGNVL